VVTSSTLEQEFGAPIALKAELFQKTGSFKVHGLLMKTLG
jgi:threonine dehydratase